MGRSTNVTFPSLRRSETWSGDCDSALLELVKMMCGKSDQGGSNLRKSAHRWAGPLSDSSVIIAEEAPRIISLESSSGSETTAQANAVLERSRHSARVLGRWLLLVRSLLGSPDRLAVEPEHLQFVRRKVSDLMNRFGWALRRSSRRSHTLKSRRS